MDPITMTLVVAATVSASTHRPKWEDQLRPAQTSTVLVMPKQELTSAPLIDRRVSGNLNNIGAHSLKEKLYQELMTYMPTGDEDPSAEPVSRVDEVLAANEFLRKLPGSISLPTLMRNESGDIGMYWDNDLVYIDVDLESSSTISLYVRDLVSDRQFMVEDVLIDQVDTEWFATHIGKALNPTLMAA